MKDPEYPFIASDQVVRYVEQCTDSRGRTCSEKLFLAMVPTVLARCIQQVADQRAHVIGLLVDGAEELQRLGQVQRRRCSQHGGEAAVPSTYSSARPESDHTPRRATRRLPRVASRPVPKLGPFEIGHKSASLVFVFATVPRASGFNVVIFNPTIMLTVVSDWAGLLRYYHRDAA